MTIQQSTGVSPYLSTLSRHNLKQMITIVRSLQSLSEHVNYASLLPSLPPNAQTPINHYSVMMGYDFHISDTQQVKLIEVNTNTGGLWYACQSYHPLLTAFPKKIANKLLNSFLSEYCLFKKEPHVIPHCIAIIDEQPEQQFLYPEMQKFQNLFLSAGIHSIIIDPKEIELRKQQLYVQQQKIDFIYNRHCDFYLETEAMQLIAQAWQQQTICLSPNPRNYGLLADKQRLIDWLKPQNILIKKAENTLYNSLPDSQLLNTFDTETLWKERKKWVFKPINSYASRGVYVGKKLTKKTFNNLDPDTTLVQHYIKPSITTSPEGEDFKTDFRLFVYRTQILAVSARLYQGQVTNLRTPNGGFSRLTII